MRAWPQEAGPVVPVTLEGMPAHVAVDLAGQAGQPAYPVTQVCLLILNRTFLTHCVLGPAMGQLPGAGSWTSI